MSAGTILKLNFLIIAFVLIIMAMVKLRSGGLGEGAQAVLGVHPAQTEGQTSPENKAAK